MKSLYKKSAVVGAIIPLLVLAGSVYAQTPPSLSDLDIGNTQLETTDQVSSFLTNILNWLFGILLVIGVGMLLYAGFLYVTAAGSDDKLKKAKKSLTWAIIGIAIALLSKSIVLLINNIFGGTGQL